MRIHDEGHGFTIRNRDDMVLCHDGKRYFWDIPDDAHIDTPIIFGNKLSAQWFVDGYTFAMDRH